MPQLPFVALCYLIIDWAVRIAFLVWVPSGRLPSAARSWLLFALFLPIPAAIVFLLIGNAKEPRWRKGRLEAFNKSGRSNAENTNFKASFNPRPLDRLMTGVGGFSPNVAAEVEFLADYDAFIDRLVTMIDGAKTSVHLLTYIFATDATGMKIIGALQRAAGRGIKCRVLYDAFGSRPWNNRLEAILRGSDVACQAASPLSMPWQRFARADLRNHRKLYIVDGKIGFVGSQNLVSRNFRRPYNNDELMIAVSGGIVADLEIQFARDWYIETELDSRSPTTLADVGAIPTHLVPTGPEFEIDGFLLVLAELLYRAETSIVLTSPYLIPDEVLMSALRAATLKGVDVQMFVSDRMDQFLVGLAQRSYYAELLGMGVRLFAYKGRLLHAKHVLVDQAIVYVGSGNTDIRSFRLNSEIGLVISDERVARQLAEIVESYRKSSDEIRRSDWQLRPTITKLSENLARLISPLL